MADTDASDEELARQWQAVVSSTARLQRVFDQDLEATGVPAQWYPVLDLLLQSPEHRLPMSSLAREISMTSGGFSKLADRMALDGLIDRRGGADDRRVVHATLTADGLRLARRLRAAYHEALRKRLVTLVTRDELANAADTLTRLATNQADDTDDADEMLVSERDPALPDRRRRGR